MGFIAKLSQFFWQGKGTTDQVESKSITQQLVGFIVRMSNFSEMQDEDVYEQIYKWESVVGSTIDRLSAMVLQSFGDYYIDDEDTNRSNLEEEMIKKAAMLHKELEIDHFIEAIAEILVVQGNVFLRRNKDNTYSFLPNRFVNWVESKEQINQMIPEQVIVERNFLTLNESKVPDVPFKVYKAEEIVHIKYKDTPIFVTDSIGRKTYDVYSLSPLNRTVLNVWWKRQILIIDVLLRWKNVPREHHKINSEIFHFANFPGSYEEKKNKANEAASQALDSYKKSLEELMPDSSYITLDNTSIEMIESRNRNITPTAGNIILTQLDNDITTGLNVPQSLISGSGGGSYASELVISNYVSSKVIQLSRRIKPVVLELMRNRLRMINPAFPIDKLDIKLELSLAHDRIQIFQEMTMMAAMGLFTEDEIRGMLPGYDSLSDEDYEKVVNYYKLNKNRENIDKKSHDANRTRSIEDPGYPDTPASAVQH